MFGDEYSQSDKEVVEFHTAEEAGEQFGHRHS
jgi:hypothetical protein